MRFFFFIRCYLWWRWRTSLISSSLLRIQADSKGTGLFLSGRRRTPAVEAGWLWPMQRYLGGGAVEIRADFPTEGSSSPVKAPLLSSVSEQLSASLFRSWPVKVLPLAQSEHRTPLKQREWRLPASPNVLSAFWSSERLHTGVNQSRVSLFI